MKLATATLLTLCLLMLGRSAFAQAPNNGVRPAQDVNVINTTGVNVENAPDVNVLSMPAITISTDVRTPYQTGASTEDWTSNSVNIPISVPSGNRMVIEHISAGAFMHPQVELASFVITTAVNGFATTHDFALPEVAPGFTGSNTYSGGQSVRLYADEFITARFSKVSVGGSLDLGRAHVAVSGYLIPFVSQSLAP